MLSVVIDSELSAVGEVIRGYEDNEVTGAYSFVPKQNFKSVCPLRVTKMVEILNF